MASLRDIKRRIQSIENISKITKAMKMVSAAKLKKSQKVMENSSVRMKDIERMIGNIVKTMKPDELNKLKYFKKNTSTHRVCLISITSNRGLCGSFNNNIIKSFQTLLSQCKDKFSSVHVINIGKKGEKHLNTKLTKDLRCIGEESCSDKLTLAQNLSQEICKNYLEGKIEEFYVTRGVSDRASSQDVKTDIILPLNLSAYSFVENHEKDIYEPSKIIFLSTLLPEYLSCLLYKVLLEAEVSEQTARMQAMENATKNSDEISNILTLQYNRARQANITRELVEIISGAEALK